MVLALPSGAGAGSPLPGCCCSRNGGPAPSSRPLGLGRAGGRPARPRPRCTPTRQPRGRRADPSRTGRSFPRSRSDSPAGGTAVSNKPQSLSGHEAAPCSHPAAGCQLRGAGERGDALSQEKPEPGRRGRAAGHGAGQRPVPREDTAPGQGDPGSQERHVAADGWKGEHLLLGQRGQRGIRCFCDRPALLPLPWGPKQPLPQPEEAKGGEEPEGRRLSRAWGQQLGKAPRSGQPRAPQPVSGRARQQFGCLARSSHPAEVLGTSPACTCPKTGPGQSSPPCCPPRIAPGAPCNPRS